MFLKYYQIIINLFKSLSIPIYRIKIEHSKLDSKYFPQYKKYGIWIFFYETKTVGYSSTTKYTEIVSFSTENKANIFILNSEKNRVDVIQKKIDSKKTVEYKRIYLNRQEKIKNLI